MRKFKRIQAALWALLLLMNVLLPATSFAAEANGIQLTMSSNVTEVESGETFTYVINYSVSSTTQDTQFTNASIEFELPGGVELKEAKGNSDVTVTTDGSLVTFTFNGDLKAGTTGVLNVQGYFTAYKTPNNKTVTAYSVFQSDQGTKTSNSVEVTAKAAADWELVKTQTRPVVTPKPGSEVEYTLTLRDKGNSTGNLEINNVVVTDTLPSEAEFVSANPAPDTVAGNQLTWDLGTLGQGSSPKVFRVKVKYPSVTDEDTVRNEAEATFRALGESSDTELHALVEHGFTAEALDDGVGLDKFVNSDHPERYPGQDVVFYIGGLSNNANVRLNDYELADLTPEFLHLKSIETPKFSGISDYDIWYSPTGNADDWVIWQEDVSADQHVTLDVADLGQPVKGFKIDFGDNVPIDFSQSGTFELTYTIDPTTPVVGDPKDPSSLTKLTNEAILSYTYVAEDSSVKSEMRSDKASVTVVGERPIITVNKSISNKKSSYDPGSELTYRISVQNTDLTDTDLHDPVITDLLPPSLEYVAGSAKLIDDAGLGLNHDEWFAAAEVAEGTLLTWSPTAGIPPGKKLEVEYKAKVKPGTAAGDIVNTAEVTSSDDYLNNRTFNSYERDGKWYVKDGETFVVTSITKLESRKWVKGELDPDWTAAGKTTPGGNIDYRLQVTNVGNIPMKELVIVDSLPKIGDRGPVTGTPRESKWSPVLSSGVTLSTYGITTYYTTDTQIDISDDVHWSTALPDDITSVTGIKFVFADDRIIQPGETIDLIWSMRAPVGAPVNEYAWSSFGYSVKQMDGTPLLDAEPPKVGVLIEHNDKGEIGNYVWLDVNKNGVQDEDPKFGVNGVEVRLLDKDGAVLATTRTGNDVDGNPGYYLFPNLEVDVTGSTYKVQFVLPDGYTGWTIPNQGSASTGSDAFNEGVTDALTLTLDDKTNYDIDAGLLPPEAELGDYVWIDSNGDGQQDPAKEKPVADVVVHLYDEHGFLLKTTKTDSEGYYGFNYLTAGTYQVEFKLPSNEYRFTVKGSDASSATDSNADETTGKSDSITLADNEKNVTIDAGLVVQGASLGNYVWFDGNENGLQDDWEQGVNGVTVKLYDKDGNQLDETVTSTVYDKPGYYLFDNLWAGDYRIEFEAPDFKFTKKGTDIESDKDSNADSTGKTDVTTLGHGESNLTIDAGLIPTTTLFGKIGNVLWSDENGNGIQDPGEKGIDGVTVTLRDGNDNLIGTTVTNSVYDSVYASTYGNYLFDHLYPGQYYVHFDLPEGYTFTKKVSGLPDEADNDSDVDPSGNTIRFMLNGGEEKLSIDAGVVPLPQPPQYGAIGDFVWIDLNEDGIQGDHEVGINGVTVELYKDGGNSPYKSVTTSTYDGIDGVYFFDGLEAGTYKVRFKLPEGYAFTAADQGAGDVLDSDARPDGWTADIQLAPGEVNLTVDGGLRLVDSGDPGSPGNPGDPGDGDGNGGNDEGNSGDDEGNDSDNGNTGNNGDNGNTGNDGDNGSNGDSGNDGDEGNIDPTGPSEPGDDEASSDEGADSEDEGNGFDPEGTQGNPNGNGSDNEGNANNPDNVGNDDAGRNKDQLPQTGEPMPLAPFFGIALCAAAAALWFRKKSA